MCHKPFAAASALTVSQAASAAKRTLVPSCEFDPAPGVRKTPAHHDTSLNQLSNPALLSSSGLQKQIQQFQWLFFSMAA
jgi:hypothetical protein